MNSNIVTFSIIVPTVGRLSLIKTLASIVPQLKNGDEILVERLDCEFGNEARDSAISRANGSHLWFMDDDDIATENALEYIRNAVIDSPKIIHIFRMMLSSGRIYWEEPVARTGSISTRIDNIGSPMIVVPNEKNKLGIWSGHGYEADGHFLFSTLALHENKILFHEEIVALIGFT